MKIKLHFKSADCIEFSIPEAVTRFEVIEEEEYRIYKLGGGFTKESCLVTCKKSQLTESVEFYLALGYNIVITKL